MLLYEQDLETALAAPRLHQQWLPQASRFERGWDPALLEALKRSNWIQKEAAKLLGVSSRVMNYKVHKHAITHDRWSRNRT